MGGKRVLLFYRDFQRFSGGHLKVWHYFNHTLASSSWRPEILFSDTSSWDGTNPWASFPRRGLLDLPDLKPDALFVAGVDWDAMGAYAASSGLPVINLIQHVHHADPANPRYASLERPALRICVSEEVRAALASTGRVNGPLYAIPNGLDREAMPAMASPQARDIDLVVEAIKAPRLAEQLLPKLQALGLRLQVLTQRIPRDQYLGWLKRAHITLFLPRAREGFYLPALEGMALDTLVICPDCEGNRSFCLDGANCLRPEYKPQALLAAVDSARRMDEAARQALMAQARSTVARHDLMAERRAFLDILEGSEWRALSGAGR